MSQYMINWGSVLLICMFLLVISCSKSDDLETTVNGLPIDNELPIHNENPPNDENPTEDGNLTDNKNFILQKLYILYINPTF